MYVKTLCKLAHGHLHSCSQATVILVIHLIFVGERSIHLTLLSTMSTYLQVLMTHGGHEQIWWIWARHRFRIRTHGIWVLLSLCSKLSDSHQTGPPRKGLFHKSGLVKVRVRSALICHSDFHQWQVQLSLWIPQMADFNNAHSRQVRETWVMG